MVCRCFEISEQWPGAESCVRRRSSPEAKSPGPGTYRTTSLVFSDTSRRGVFPALERFQRPAAVRKPNRPLTAWSDCVLISLAGGAESPTPRGRRRVPKAGEKSVRPGRRAGKRDADSHPGARRSRRERKRGAAEGERDMRAPSTTASDFDSCRAGSSCSRPSVFLPFAPEDSAPLLHRSLNLPAAGTTGANIALHLPPRGRSSSCLTPTASRMPSIESYPAAGRLPDGLIGRGEGE
jgi:hypothetical protein